MDEQALMPSWVATVVAAGYVSLAVELACLHVPSVASSRGLWSAHPALVEGYSSKYRRVFHLPLSLRLAAFGMPLLVVYGVYAYPWLTLWAGPNPFQDYLFVPAARTDLAGATLIVFGRALSLVSALTIRRGNEQSGDSFRLHTAGPFRWSRNPGLLGMYIFVFGLWLTAPSLAMLLGIAVYVVYMDFKVRMEEDFLANKFGTAYVEYQLRTGRYLS